MLAPKTAEEIQKVGVWTDDDISPASYLLSYKHANAVLIWTPYATTRVLSQANQAQVILHQDGTIL
jgi:hypothetical protein